MLKIGFYQRLTFDGFWVSPWYLSMKTNESKLRQAHKCLPEVNVTWSVRSWLTMTSFEMHVVSGDLKLSRVDSSDMSKHDPLSVLSGDPSPVPRTIT